MSLGEHFDSVLDAARAGAAWAVGELYGSLNPAVLGYLRSQEPGDADDLASDTWLNVAGGIGRFQGAEVDFRRWVFAIARRRLIDFRRKRTRRATDPSPTERLEAGLGHGDAEAEAMVEISTESSIALIRKLPPDQAEVVLLRIIGQFDAEEVAEITGRRPGTVRVLQHRALSRLARILSAEAVTP
jgi:RNA polymerase sigma factor (sigma-70 family)